jgi:predicted amidohydrolase
MKDVSRRAFLTASTIAGALAVTGRAAPPSRQARDHASENTRAPEGQAAREPGPLIVALLQMEPNGADQAANLEHDLEFCRRASAMGADIALLPEMWNIGYTRFKGTDPETVRAWQAQAVARDSDFVQEHMALAKELNMAIAVTYLEQWQGPPRNAVTLIDRHGRQVLTYAKVHTCDFKSMECAVSPGDDFHVCELDTARGPVKVGAMICYDREQPESARILMLKGAELILTPNACILDELRLDQFKTRAFENAVGVAMTNYAAPGLNGQSIAFDAAGRLIVQAGRAEGIYLAAFDLADMREYRAKTIWGSAFRRPHRYGMLTDTNKAPVFERKDGFGKPFVASDR